MGFYMTYAKLSEQYERFFRTGLGYYPLSQVTFRSELKKETDLYYLFIINRIFDNYMDDKYFHNDFLLDLR
jgi:hypothetical protein